MQAYSLKGEEIFKSEEQNIKYLEFLLEEMKKDEEARKHPFKDFDFTDFWDDSDDALELYVSEFPTGELISEIEGELGYKLPASYIHLMKQHNGGMPFNALSEAVIGVTAIADIEEFVAYTEKARISDIVSALENFDMENALTNFSMKKCKEAEIYPDIWDYEEEIEEIKEEVYEQLKEESLKTKSVIFFIQYEHLFTEIYTFKKYTKDVYFNIFIVKRRLKMDKKIKEFVKK